ncbi:MAG: FAD-dependent oxidoreductase [Chitinophagaceae bacterium]|nr:FAD-dependent oxidoreductase [Chitinophagaceae bacterium]
MATRRKFIRNSMLIGGGLIASGAFGIPYYNQSKGMVIILGAGFSGLAAAYALHKRKIPFVILEARNRIGGRVFSFEADPAEKLVIELGAEWVGASHERLIALCEELNLTLENNQFDSHLVFGGRYYPKGEWDFTEPWRQTWDTLMKGYHKMTDAQKKDIDKYDWWRYLVNNGCSGWDLDLRDLLDSTDFGESIRHVSAFAALAEYADSSPKNEMDFKIKGGNSRFADAIVQKIGMDHIKLNHKAIKIEQGKGVKVTCENGEVFTGIKLICTAPTFAVKQIQWIPSLPVPVQKAMNELQYARINKHPVLFSDRFWKDESFDMVTDLPSHYFYHATKNQSSRKGILISYTTGDKAAVVGANSKDDEWNARMVADGLRPAFGDISNKMEKQWNYYWGNDAISQGAYALYKPGQWFTVMPKLKEPFLHTLFAGEHLADWQGFMEGAIVTGEEAAAKI